MAQIQSALRADRLLLAFQPIVVADTGAVHHYECLLRLREDDARLLPAAEVMPAIEDAALLRRIDRWVLGLALTELSQHPALRLAINVSLLAATDRIWHRRIKAALNGRRALAERLTIEISEALAIKDLAETARFVRWVQGLGCRVALDDFGAGETTIRHLRELPADAVKIDGSHVRGIVANRSHQLFLHRVVGLAAGLGLEMVAEGVETPEDAAFLASQGVTLMQGYHFGVPSLRRPWQG